MGRDNKIANAFKRSEVHRKSKREKAQEKLKRRMETKKAEKEKGTGEQLKRERLAKNVPRTLDNTRIYDSTSYLTANPATVRAAAERAAEESRKINGEAIPSDHSASEDEDEEEEEDEDEDEEMPEAGPSRPSTLLPTAPAPEELEEAGEGEEEQTQQPDPSTLAPPRILITTSPSPCKSTYAFCDDLKHIFPGGEFFKRPKGRGFEIGRVARWAAKRGYGACIVVNEDHKIPNAITLMALPSGPTAYFKLSSVVLGSQIHGHARASPHSPELILNNFTTLLGNSVGRLFGSLFPPMPMFKGRQVVTLHNQRDFLFFRRHRYMFASATSAKLQEIGPRFTLKLRWLRKGLPGVTSADGQVPRGGDKEDVDFDEDNVEVAREEKMDEDAAMEEMASGAGNQKVQNGPAIPALDEEQEYEWKWKPKMEVSRRTFFL
ncbi:anticodon-binding protein [Naematelia encephala]|uniref:Anticodon-binding protein n=1 Tax=Naematelia encephala TaxID=71784 RepID=A0A1Y2B8U2_9TREE|nr:anticodon-binding protein [Naematelia encephala]